MELHGREIILNLKNRFMDIVVRSEGIFQYENIVHEMINNIKLLIEAKEVTIYSYYKLQEQLFVEDSTNEEVKKGLETAGISFLSMKEKLFSNNVFRKPFMLDMFKQYDLLILIGRNENFLGALCLKEGNKSFSEYSDQILVELGEECSFYIQKAQQFMKIINEEKRYKQLYRVTEKFHSSMNKESVLEEIILTLQDVYPTFTYYLFLSQDHKGYEGLPIKSLDYDSEENALMQSYVAGTITFEDSAKDRRSILYAPLQGKQGVYGVLQVIAPNTLVFPSDEVEFITLLAKTAGGAIENAQLYQQSKQLISDLQLINETSRYLNTHLRLVETMEYMTQQIIKSFLAEESAFILFSYGDMNPIVQPGSTRFFFTEEARGYIDYFKEKIMEEKEALFISDLVLQPSSNGNPDCYQSAMAIPMMQSGVLKGFALTLHHEPYYFSFETFKLFSSLIQHSTLAFTNTILREELEKMVITDYLTKLYSRNFLDDKIKASMQEDDGGTFIIIDIDNFKVINDRFGHQVGDEVIIQVADIIRSNIRGTDIGARWGGEELAVYLPRIPIEIGVQIAERLVQRVRETSQPPVTVSCGLSYWQKSKKDSYHSLFKRADKALYTAKETGKNKVVIEEPNEIW